MSLMPILRGQSIKIDNHQRGTSLPNDWKDKNQDIHIDKTTKEYKLKGKRVTVRIKIPINSDKPMSYSIKGEKTHAIPKDLLKEIQNAFSDKQSREVFVSDLIDIINNYNTVMATPQNAIDALNRLSKHFDLEWTNNEIATFVNKKLQAITLLYRSKEKKHYFISLNQQNIKLGEMDAWSKHEINLNNINM